MVELIIAEKQRSAKKIADTIGKYTEHTIEGLKLYCIDSKNILIGHVSGHVCNWTYSDKYKKWANINFKQFLEVNPISKYQPRYEMYFKDIFSKHQISKIGIFTDKDSEGELIGVTIVDLIKKLDENTNLNLIVNRYVTSALTVKDIAYALSNPKLIDYNLAESAKTKHYIDLQWGSLLTVIFSVYSGKLYSAGRVQTPVLNLIVEKQNEIDQFEKKVYYVLSMETPYGVFNSEPLDDLKPEILTNLQKIKVHGCNLEISPSITKYPPKPLNSTDLLKFSRQLSVDGYKCMQIAQSLYLKGLITYPRSDSRFLTFEQIQNIYLKLNSSLIYEPYTILTGEKDDAHPPIMITAERVQNAELTYAELKLYNLIYRHYESILEGPYVYDLYSYKIQYNDITFKLFQEKCIRKGYNKDPVEFMDIGSEIEVHNVIQTEKFTKPPSMYSEGTIVKKMESLGIGTKATRHTFMNLLRSRNYVDKFKPTDKGKLFSEILHEYCPIITSALLTRTIEDDLLKIVEGSTNHGEVYTKHKQVLRSIIAEIDAAKEGIINKFRSISIYEERPKSEKGQYNTRGRSSRFSSSYKNRKTDGGRSTRTNSPYSRSNNSTAYASKFKPFTKRSSYTEETNNVETDVAHKKQFSTYNKSRSGRVSPLNKTFNRTRRPSTTMSDTRPFRSKFSNKDESNTTKKPYSSAFKGTKFKPAFYSKNKPKLNPSTKFGTSTRGKSSNLRSNFKHNRTNKK